MKKPRKKISQRAAIRMRKQLNLICSGSRCGKPISTFSALGSGPEIATYTAITCGHAVLAYLNTNGTFTLHAFKP